MNNQVNSNLSNNFSRNNSQYDQSFVNQTPSSQQQQQSSYTGGSGGKWSSQYDNSLGFDGNVGNNSSNNMMINGSNYSSNPTLMRQHLGSSQPTQQQQGDLMLQQAPMSTAMKIMQTVIPRHARPSLMTNTSNALAPSSSSFETSSYPRPFRKSFPRSGDSTVIGRKRERSRSKSPHIRSRSPSTDRHPRGRGRGGRGFPFPRDSSPGSTTRPVKKIHASRSPPRSTGLRSNSPPSVPVSVSSTAGGSTKLEIANLTSKDLVEDLHLPAVSKNLLSLSMLDISSKFPKLYIPADFTDLKIDWSSITCATVYDFFFNLSASAPIMFENTPSTLKAEECEAKGEDALPSPSGKFFSDILEPSKFSYVSSNTFNNVLSETQMFNDRFINTEKPIKFNAKVLVCCGLKDPETERIDHNYSRKLRFVSLNRR